MKELKKETPDFKTFCKENFNMSEEQIEKTNKLLNEILIKPLESQVKDGIIRK